jgi:hypothetical protein
VRAAALLGPGPTDGDARGLDAVALPDHELMWFAPSELADLLG